MTCASRMTFMAVKDQSPTPGDPGWSPELETLDQLQAGDLPVAIVRRLFDDDNRFARGVEAMRCDGQIQLLTAEGHAVPKWQWREFLNTVAGQSEPSGHMLSMTMKGGRQIS